MGRAKAELEAQQEAGDCPECDVQCEINDDGYSECPECETVYQYKCSGCGCPSESMGMCTRCFSNSVNKDD